MSMRSTLFGCPMIGMIQHLPEVCTVRDQLYIYSYILCIGCIGCIARHCIALHCFALHCIELHCIALLDSITYHCIEFDQKNTLYRLS